MERTKTPLDSPAIALEIRVTPVVVPATHADPPLIQGVELVRGLTFDQRCRLWESIFGEPHPLSKPVIDPHEDYSFIKG